MSRIWRKDADAWAPLGPTGFPDEARLHDLIEEAPHMLPLSGEPRLVMLGREVRLGVGYCDLLAIESTGRIAVVEIKLSRNPEARRAIVSQVFAYAAYLHGLDFDAFAALVQPYLDKRGVASLEGALRAEDQVASFDADEFYAGVTTCLAEGSFRLVFVLDSPPEELVRIARYLEVIAPKLIVDLIGVSAYEVHGAALMVPQRIDPGRMSVETPARPRAVMKKGTLTTGSAVFEASIARAAEDEQPRLRRLVAWAHALETDGLAELVSYEGVIPRWILLPRFQPDNVGLVSLWNDGKAAIQFSRSVFQRRAPHSIAPIEAKLGKAIGQGNQTREFDDELLGLLFQAYRDAHLR